MACIVVVGACNTDLTSYTSRIPKQGETVQGTSFGIGFGGKGANQCIQASKLGARTAMIAKLGQDEFGRNYCQNFDDFNVNRQYVQCLPNISTGTATIIVDEKGANYIVVVPGANLHLTPADILNAEELIRNCKVVVCDGEVRQETAKEALRIGKKFGATTLMNAAPANASMDEGIYGLSSIFCVNETEAEILLNRPLLNLGDAEVAAEEMLKKGSSNVIITLGKKGAVLANERGVQHIPSALEISSVIDTTGAGDSFVGTLAYYLCSSPGMPIEKMIEKSCKIASYSVQFKGTQTSFPNWNQLKDLEI